MATKRTTKRTQKKSSSSLEYFGSKPRKEIGAALMDKVEDFYQAAHEDGKLDLWRRSYKMFNSSYLRGARVITSGENNEYELININHYKNILLHLHVNATSQRVAFEPKASNTDTKSQAQTLLASSLLGYYTREKRMERYLKQADLDALIYSEGYVAVEWDANLGEPVRPDIDDRGELTNKFIREGDIKYGNYTPNNVIRDYAVQSWDDNNWLILRDFKDKHEVAADFPELKDRIIALQYRERRYLDRLSDTKTSKGKTEDDQIPVYTFYHKPGKLIPEGRLVKFLDDDLVLLDGPLPYSEIPVYRETPEELDDSPFGSTVGWDLLAIQDIIDLLFSIIITNQKTFGVQCVISPRGSNLDLAKLAEGLTHIEYTATANGGKPEALNLLQTPGEIFTFIDSLVNTMETISGINSVVRGDPQASLQSGAALALVHSTAIQFAQGQQESYNNLIQDVGTATINILKRYATTKRVATISGRSNRQYLKEFTGDDIADISRVTVDSGNPLTRTIAGRVNLAEQLMNNQLIKTPQEYLMVLQTGQLEPLVEGETAELMLIQSENEDIADGKEVMAVLTDDHNLHIREHRAVLASPDARRDPQRVQATLTHIQEHLNILMDPANTQVLIMFGQTPLGMASQQEGQAPDGSEALSPTPEGINNPADVPSPNLPKLPNLPGEGEYSPELGAALPS